MPILDNAAGSSLLDDKPYISREPTIKEIRTVLEVANKAIKANAKELFGIIFSETSASGAFEFANASDPNTPTAETETNM